MAPELNLRQRPEVAALSLNNVSNVTVKNFMVTGGWFGISVDGTLNIIANNTISRVENGIYSLDEPTAGISVSGDSNIISGNILSNNNDGIAFYSGENNLIVGNTVEDSSNPTVGDGTGIFFWGASNNTIYHNNFINNSEQAGDGSKDSAFPTNIWDNGILAGGITGVTT